MKKQLLYRGTQGPSPEESVRKSLSFTPCMAVATVYSARPANPWVNVMEAEFLPSSTVHAAVIASRRMLKWPWTAMAFDDVLQTLKYGERDGITEAEAIRVLNYMHNRILGRAAGGEFKYVVLDEFLERYEEDEEPWGLLQTGVDYFRSEFKYDPTVEVARRLQADTYVFADAPVIEVVARRLGFDSMSYEDVFSADDAVEDLLGVDIEQISCVTERDDVAEDWVPTHETVRPFAGTPIDYQWSRPALDVLKDVMASEIVYDDE